LQECLEDVPLLRIGRTCQEPDLRIAGNGGEYIVACPLADLKEAWHRPLGS
jgi:hypothetical protein